jgi:hypothetical protein
MSQSSTNKVTEMPLAQSCWLHNAMARGWRKKTAHTWESWKGQTYPYIRKMHICKLTPSYNTINPLLYVLFCSQSPHLSVILCLGLSFQHMNFL